jgi:hypothetical protein
LKSAVNFRSIPEDVFADHMAGLDNAGKTKVNAKYHNRREVVARRNQITKSPGVALPHFRYHLQKWKSG